MFLDGVGGIDGHLIVGLVAVLDAKVVRFEFQIEIGMDQLVFDDLPDNPRHLVAVEFDERVCDLDLVHGRRSPFFAIFASCGPESPAGVTLRL